MNRKRANEQHIDYLRQLKGPRPQRKHQLDPKIHRSVDEIRQVFNHPEMQQQPLRELPLKPMGRILNPQYDGLLGKLDLEPFGRIEVVHGDIFQAETEVVMIPMAPNLVPYRGLGLQVFDRGGETLVKETFATAKEQYTKDQENAGSAGVQAGDTIVVRSRALAATEGREAALAAENTMFVIMPWFWEGSPLDAGKRLRYCVQRAFSVAASTEGFAHVVLPNLGGGVFGYEPRGSSRVMLEEAVEAMLQIEAQTPVYKLKQITFMDSNKETAQELHEALIEVSHRWLPDHRLQSAPQYWSEATRKLLVLPAVPSWFLKRDPVKFKKFHGLKRKARRNWVGNIKPMLWRPHKVHQPPPLLVYRDGGDTAPQDRQLKARPYYFRGVTHWLFPSRRSGFHSLRLSSKGQWVAQNQGIKYQETVRPRL